MSLILSGSDGVSDIDGSASTPAIRGTDANTGIFFPAADTIGFAEGGAEAMRIDSSGNVGIGTTSPATLLNLDRSNVAFRGQLTINGGSGGLAHLTLYNGSTTATNLTGNLYSSIDNVGVHLNAYQTTGYIAFETNNFTERARITSDGKFLVNETAQLAGYNQQATITCSGSNVLALALKASGSGNIALATTSTDTSTYNAAVFANNGNFSGALKGSISVSNSATTYNTSSDYRLKENVAPMTGALATIAALKPCTYTWKADGSVGQGFIAHELQEVAPYAVTGEKDGEEMQGVDYGKITPLLTAALQEAIAKIKTLEARIAVLEAK